MRSNRTIWILTLLWCVYINKTGGFAVISRCTFSLPSSTNYYETLSLSLSLDAGLDIDLSSSDQVSQIKPNSSLSSAAQWHSNRRKAMLEKYHDQIYHLEQQTHGLFVGMPLLIFSNLLLGMMAIKCQSLSVLQIIMLSIPGSILSLWTLQILHDALHSSLLPKPSYRKKSKIMEAIIRHRRKIQDTILFFGSMPSAFGFYLYLKYGHLTHHKNLGDRDKVSLFQVFDSSKKDFEDGDILFTAHRMKILGELGPAFSLKWPKERKVVLSISNAGFTQWKEGRSIRNAVIFSCSFLLERAMLILNDLIVALTGKNYFFPNKPDTFHEECRLYCLWAVSVRLALCAVAKSFKPLLFLYLAETLWSLPPHPCSAMFITNHGSSYNGDDKSCIPSSSTYAGKWYNILTLNTNLHVEHHDFPSIPCHKLGQLRKIAPEFYRDGEKDSIFGIMKKSFSHPEFYACMNANNFEKPENSKLKKIQ